MTLKSKGLDALFGSRHGILFCTHLEPSRWWTRLELATHCGTAPEHLAEDLVLLSAGEILSARGEGDEAEYQANPACAFFAELQAMMAKAATRDEPAGLATILVVDDQPATLKVARILLESFGYAVLAAGNGQEAMILFRRHQEQIRLLLTDVVMPDITGPQLAERLLRMNPDLRVIYMSGYPHEEELHGVGVLFLAKPFNPAGLSKAVREALDAG
jgi:two-component system cell cycle sensor histidine kinase/response regulator CckA